jgi:hypothetical protein
MERNQARALAARQDIVAASLNHAAVLRPELGHRSAGWVVDSVVVERDAAMDEPLRMQRPECARPLNPRT